MFEFNSEKKWYYVCWLKKPSDLRGMAEKKAFLRILTSTTASEFHVQIYLFVPKIVCQWHLSFSNAGYSIQDTHEGHCCVSDCNLRSVYVCVCVCMLSSVSDEMSALSTKPEHDRVKTMLYDTLTLLCRSGISYAKELRIEGVIAITVDGRDVVVVHVDEHLSGTAREDATCSAKERSKFRSKRTSNDAKQNRVTFSVNSTLVAGYQSTPSGDETLRSDATSSNFHQLTDGRGSGVKRKMKRKRLRRDADNKMPKQDDSHRTELSKRDERDKCSTETSGLIVECQSVKNEWSDDCNMLPCQQLTELQEVVKGDDNDASWNSDTEALSVTASSVENSNSQSADGALQTTSASDFENQVYSG